MRFFSLIASAALAAVAVAQNASPVKITNPAVLPKAGETIIITYEPATASVTLILKNGKGDNLQTVSTIGTSSSGSISWSVPRNIPNDEYALEIKPATGESNYVGPFKIQGATAPVVSSSASATASSSASSSASSGSVTRSSGSSSASASASVSHSTNGTVSSATLSTATSTGSRPTNSAATTTGSAPPTNTNAAGSLAQSPMALVLGALAAFAYLA